MQHDAPLEERLRRVSRDDIAHVTASDVQRLLATLRQGSNSSSSSNSSDAEGDVASVYTAARLMLERNLFAEVYANCDTAAWRAAAAAAATTPRQPLREAYKQQCSLLLGVLPFLVKDTLTALRRSSSNSSTLSRDVMLTLLDFTAHQHVLRALRSGVAVRMTDELGLCYAVVARVDEGHGVLCLCDLSRAVQHDDDDGDATAAAAAATTAHADAASAVGSDDRAATGLTSNVVPSHTDDGHVRIALRRRDTTIALHKSDDDDDEGCCVRITSSAHMHSNNSDDEDDANSSRVGAHVVYNLYPPCREAALPYTCASCAVCSSCTTPSPPPSLLLPLCSCALATRTSVQHWVTVLSRLCSGDGGGAHTRHGNDTRQATTAPSPPVHAVRATTSPYAQLLYTLQSLVHEHTRWLQHEQNDLVHADDTRNNAAAAAALAVVSGDTGGGVDDAVREPLTRPATMPHRNITNNSSSSHADMSSTASLHAAAMALHHDPVVAVVATTAATAAAADEHNGRGEALSLSAAADAAAAAAAAVTRPCARPARTSFSLGRLGPLHNDAEALRLYAEIHGRPYVPDSHNHAATSAAAAAAATAHEAAAAAVVVTDAATPAARAARAVRDVSTTASSLRAYSTSSDSGGSRSHSHATTVQTAMHRDDDSDIVSSSSREDDDDDDDEEAATRT